MSRLRLSCAKDKPIAEGYVFYNEGEMGLDTYPDRKSSITLLAAYVNIGFRVETMCANQVFGLAPISSWKKRRMTAPQPTVRCALRLDEDFDYGTWRTDEGNEGRYYFDAKSGWWCVGDTSAKGAINVNFIDNAIAVLDEQGELKALWVKPVFR